ncbi:MAG: oligosaccharide flippase family protein [Bacteroidales bacterium]|nr:oligosaccharide flippase family protein [Bacteroidales bacterium]MBN2761986.1 oligosaccharide flippase family protein [Bacteroidales bacterium]
MFRNLIPKTEFTRNILTLMTGNTIAQIIQIAIIPILARLYTPADFGVFAVYLSLSTIISTVASLRYDLAIMLPKEEKEAVNLLTLSVFLATLISVVAFAGIFLFRPVINHYVHNKDIVKWLFYIPLTIFLSSMYQIFNVWLNRKKQYKVMTASIISQRGTISLTNILMGLAKFGQAGLIFGNIIGQFVSAIILFIKSIFSNRKELSMASAVDMKKAGLRFKKFPLYDTPNTIFFNFSTKGIIVLLSKLFGDVVVGFYSMTEKIMITPFSFFTNAFSQAFYQKQSYIYNFDRSNFNNLINQAIHKMALIITVPFIIMVVTSKWYIPVILGREWEIIYRYIFIFAPFVYVSLTGSPYTHVLKIIDKQNIALVMNLVTFIIKFLSILIPFYLFHSDIFATIVIFSACSYLTTILAVVVINHYLGLAFSRYFSIVSAVAAIFYVLFFILY